jgi:hypothetical protein
MQRGRKTPIAVVAYTQRARALVETDPHPAGDFSVTSPGRDLPYSFRLRNGACYPAAATTSF